MLIQDNGRWCGRVHHDPFVEGLKKRSEGFGIMIQFDGVRCPVHPNNFSRCARRTLEALQNIPDKGQLQFLLFADAVRPYKNRGFVAVFPKRRGPLYPGQNTTICCKSLHLEMSIDQRLAPLAEVLQRVGLHLRVCLLQAVDISLLIRTPLLFENLDVLVEFPFVWTEQQEIGFPRT